MSRGDSMNRRDFFVQTIALGVGLTPTGKNSARGNASPANISSTDSRGKTMKHKVIVTVIDKKLYPDLQRQYCANSNAGYCPCYNLGDTFVFERDNGKDDYWHMGLNTLIKTSADPNTVAGGPKVPFCSEAWDAISRYIYTGLQGGSIMRGWMQRENEMIACCKDGTRPVIFKIERVDYED